MNLKNKIMLITGASSGIGAATAKIAAQEGAQVILLARTRSKLDQVADDIQRDGGRAYVYPVDLTDADAVTAVAESVKAEVGVPDIIMNSAGIGQWKFVEETSSEEAVRMMAAPYFAAFFTTRALLSDILKRNSGTIINMTSIASHMVWPGATAYTAARWAMRGFAEGLQADLYRTRIHTMLVTFAKVESSYWENNPGSEEKVPGAQSMIPVLTSEQAARAIISGIKRNKREVIAPFTLRVLIVLNNLFPSITRWLLVLTGHKRESSIRH